jgi:DNA-binding transcriptional regulator YiaG
MTDHPTPAQAGGGDGCGRQHRQRVVPSNCAHEPEAVAAGGYERICALSSLVKTPNYKAVQIKKIREAAKVSQPIFAMYLNTSESTIQKWEAGTKKPSGMALKLLDIVHKHGLGVLA